MEWGRKINQKSSTNGRKGRKQQWIQQVHDQHGKTEIY
jgi:hypothetical protein